METIRTSLDADHILTILLDAPGRPVNTCSPRLLDDLADVLDLIVSSPPAGVIVTSAKARSFNAGADLFAIRDMTEAAFAAHMARGQSVFDRLARLPVPTVAAINGDCLGGGFELALACAFRVAADNAAVSIGLPEVKLGLIPAWGGATRLPRLIGLRTALPTLVAGKTMPPREALRARLVDEVAGPDALLGVARRLILDGVVGRRRPTVARRMAARLTPGRSRALDDARRQTEARTFGHYPAPLRLLDVIRTGYAEGFAAGLAAERAAIADLRAGPAARNLMRAFFLRQGAKRRAAEHVLPKPTTQNPTDPPFSRDPKGSATGGETALTPPDVHDAAVIGGGTMGAGVAHALVRAGVRVTLIEVDAAAASAALGRVRKAIDADVTAGRTDDAAARGALDRLTVTTDWAGVAAADLAVEAVVETLDAKRAVFARLDAVCRADAVLATNTSSLRVADIAAATARPGRVVGLHFFNPVAKMPLIEVVRAPASDAAALATAVALATRLGKTPVVVNDAPGFLVNRVLFPHLGEAIALAREGVPIATIDDAIRRWGMPMGPFELMDEIGLDVALHIFRALAPAFVSPPPIPAALERAVARGDVGRKAGRGFYLHDRDARGGAAEARLNPAVSLAAGACPAFPDPADVQWRLMLAMVNEAARAMADGVTDSADDVDLATVMGLGFAPFRGGLATFADDAGPAEIVRRLEGLAAAHGPRFRPAELLRQQVREQRNSPV